MTAEDVIKVLKIKVTEHAKGEPKYRVNEQGRKMRVFETITRDATVADVLSFNESTGGIVMNDGKKYNVFESF